MIRRPLAVTKVGTAEMSWRAAISGDFRTSISTTRNIASSRLANHGRLDRSFLNGRQGAQSVLPNTSSSGNSGRVSRERDLTAVKAVRMAADETKTLV